MAAPLKYFGIRILNGIIVLLLVVFILTTLLHSMEDAKWNVVIREQIRVDVNENQDALKEMTLEERLEWMKERKERYQEQYGVDTPIFARSFNQSIHILSGDLGQSNWFVAADGSGSSDVAYIIMTYLPRSIVLFSMAALIYITLGLVVGLKAAQVVGSKVDKFLSVFSITASSMPMWWLAMIAVMIFGYKLDILPPSAVPFPKADGINYYLGVLYRMILPLGVIVFNLFGARAWITRNIVVDVLEDDYIMAARSKGIPERKVIYGHTLKTSAPPIITSSILAFMTSLTFSIITEAVVGWPGIGRLFYLSFNVTYRMVDVNMVIGIVFAITLIYVAAYVLADIVYGLLDPRVKVGASEMFK